MLSNTSQCVDRGGGQLVVVEHTWEHDGITHINTIAMRDPNKHHFYTLLWLNK